MPGTVSLWSRGGAAEVVLVCVDDGVYSIAKLQLLEEVLDVGAHGRFFDTQRGRYLGIGQTPGDLLEDVALATGERGEPCP